VFRVEVCFETKGQETGLYYGNVSCCIDEFLRIPSFFFFAYRRQETWRNQDVQKIMIHEIARPEGMDSYEIKINLAKETYFCKEVFLKFEALTSLTTNIIVVWEVMVCCECVQKWYVVNVYKSDDMLWLCTKVMICCECVQKWWYIVNVYKSLGCICYPDIQPKIVLLKMKALGFSTTFVSIYPNRRCSSQVSVILEHFPYTRFMYSRLYFNW
jgi:hypothetical protein